MVGQTISQYRVEGELGRVGMGVVYRAYDLRLKREVALKLLAQEIANQEQSRERVLAEARSQLPQSPRCHYDLRSQVRGRISLHRHGTTSREDSSCACGWGTE